MLSPSLPSRFFPVLLLLPLLGCEVELETRPDAFTLTEDQPLEVNAANGVLANDTGYPGGLTAGVAEGPGHGSLELRRDGSFTYVPDPDFAGEDSFRYSVGCADYCDEKSPPAFPEPTLVTLTIEPVNDAPFAGSVYAVAAPGQTVSLDLLGRAFDIEGDPLQVSSAGPVENGTIQLASDGTATYTPGSDTSEDIVTFPFVVTDDAGGSGQAMATVVVLEPFLPESRIELISRVPDGPVANRSVAGAHAISATGRFVAFSTAASNLSAGDTNQEPDIFLYDRQTRVLTLISVGWNGSPADGASRAPSLSADGRFLAFESDASNLVQGDTNGHTDVFVFDTADGTTTIVSRNADDLPADAPSSAPVLSASGRKIAFISRASNLVADNAPGRAFVRDLDTGTVVRVSTPNDVSSIAASADLRYIALGGGLRGLVIDTSSDRAYAIEGAYPERVQITGDGSRWIYTIAEQIYLGSAEGEHDYLVTTAADETSPGDGRSRHPALSADGSAAAFASSASNLAGTGPDGQRDHIFTAAVGVPGDNELIDVADTGQLGNATATTPSLSADGKWVGFVSKATNLTAGNYDGDTSQLFVANNPLRYVPSPAP